MNIVKHEVLSKRELLARIQKTRLRGHGRPFIYENAKIELRQSFDPKSLIPAQRYVLHEDFLRIEDLYHNFLALEIDIFALEFGLLFWMKDSDTGEIEGPIPLIPPIIEESREPSGNIVPLINDGMHRVYAAKRLGKSINVIYVRNVPATYPYYAYAMENGWEDVDELEELPDNFIKKEYRDPENYKALFRDFNEVLPGVQKQRKRSNPEHIVTSV